LIKENFNKGTDNKKIEQTKAAHFSVIELNAILNRLAEEKSKRTQQIIKDKKSKLFGEMSHYRIA
jgi:hypothetical protein